MSHSLDALKEELIRQTVFFEEQRVSFLDQYFPMRGAKSPDRILAEQRLDRYVSVLQQMTAEIAAGKLPEPPRVIVGSRVMIRYGEEPDHETIRLCFPEQTDPDRGMISFLSPLGLELLAASLHDTVILQAPAGLIRIRVVGVEYDR